MVIIIYINKYIYLLYFKMTNNRETCDFTFTKTSENSWIYRPTDTNQCWLKVNNY